MNKIKHSIRTFISLITGARKLLVFYTVALVALVLLYLKQVTGAESLVTIKEIGIAYVTANVFTKFVDLGKKIWAKKK